MLAPNALPPPISDAAPAPPPPAQPQTVVVQYRHHATGLQVGAEFLYRGLRGQTVEKDKYVVILGISVTGRVSFRIDTAGVKGNFISDIDYANALMLIRDGIWLSDDASVSYRQIDDA